MEATDQPHFIEGSIYSRREHINRPFGGNSQSGISPSTKSRAVFIFTGEEGEQFGYIDSWDEQGQVFTYTGEGQIGPMTFARGNRAIRDHIQDGRALHLFKKHSRAGGLYQYVGEMQCADTMMVEGPDREGNLRPIIQFKLVRLRAIPAADESDSPLPATALSDLLALRDKAYAAVKSQGSKAKSAVHSIYDRSRDVARYVLSRSKGTCEGCRAPAPFLRKNGTPYLEVHHIDRVSDGGLDCPTRVAAVCPTCHRRAHHSVDGKSFNDQLRIRVAALEAAF